MKANLAIISGLRTVVAVAALILAGALAACQASPPSVSQTRAVPLTPRLTATPTVDQWLQRVEPLLAAGEYEQAVSILADLRKAAPNRADVKDQLYQTYLAHGAALQERGELEDSFAQYERALELRKDDPVALDGQKHVARLMLRAVDLSPDALEPQLRLARMVLYCRGYTVAVLDRPWIAWWSYGTNTNPSCTNVYVVGRSEVAGRNFPEGFGTGIHGQEDEPRRYWYFVRNRTQPLIEGWVEESPAFTKLGLNDELARLPVVPLPVTNPDTLPDMSFGATSPGARPGDPCGKPGPVEGNVWQVVLRNSGESTGPRIFEVLVKTPGTADQRVAYELVRGFEPNEEVRIGWVRDNSSVTFDPDNELQETDKANNELRTRTGPQLICVPR